MLQQDDKEVIHLSYTSSYFWLWPVLEIITKKKGCGLTATVPLINGEGEMPLWHENGAPHSHLIASP